MVSKWNTLYFISKAKEVHGDEYDYKLSVCNGVDTKVEIICNTHGKFLQSAYNHVLRNQGCPLCKFERTTKTKLIKNNLLGKIKFKFKDNKNIYVSNDKLYFTCLKHGDMYVNYKRSLLQRKNLCNKCSYENRIISNNSLLSNDEVIKRFRKIHGDKYDYDLSNYSSCVSKIKIFCKFCKEFFYMTTINHYKYGCKKCKNKENEQLRLIKFKARCNILYNKKYIYDDVFNLPISRKLKIKIYCTQHKTHFYQHYKDHLSGRSGCLLCAKNSKAEAFKSNTEEFIRKATLLHGDKYDYSLVEYDRAWIKVKIICKYDNNIFYQTPNSHLSGHGCPLCSNFISQKEKLWLDIIGIPDDKEHRQVFVTIGNISFNVDGYNPKTNTVYEFNGDFWHGNPASFNSKKLNPKLKVPYGTLYYETIKKETLLKENGYTVISIWEADFDLIYGNKSAS